mgnify:CR=1 FL=1|tara:strand:+ start:2111 stop:2326 length:216 start_codon:yes stop_codon:yes gene_type:complete
MSNTTVYEVGGVVGFCRAVIQTGTYRKEGFGVVSIMAGPDEVTIHFESLDSFLAFCKKHNISYVDLRCGND